mmetsp:Transcript_11800/g.27095  ORF Transcript_11800/g.27095 Transcript_11800/m.27095 type:complete len:256 (-) Transcript_11800:931-1698(-)
MRVEKLAVVDGLAHNPPDKVEVAEVVRAEDVRPRVRLEGQVAAHAVSEQANVGVEHLARQHQEPFSRYTTGIDTLLALEGHAQAALHLVGCAGRDLVEGVLKERGAPHTDAHCTMPHTLVAAAHVAAEVPSLVVEVEELREPDERLQARGEEGGGLANEGVEKEAVSLSELCECCSGSLLLRRQLGGIRSRRLLLVVQAPQFFQLWSLLSSNTTSASRRSGGLSLCHSRRRARPIGHKKRFHQGEQAGQHRRDGS